MLTGCLDSRLGLTSVRVAAVLAVLTALMFSSPVDSGAAAGSKLKIVTTIGMITDIVQNVAGDAVEVSALMGAGVDPHLYKASAGDVRRLAEADIIFYNGLHLEAKMADVLEQMGQRKKTVAVTDRIDRAKLNKPPQFAGAYDPHVWFDVTMWMTAAEVVRDTLCEAMPDRASAFKANAEKYLGQLRELDAYVRAQAAKLPAAQRVLVTAHDAFHYFGQAYGFEVRGLQGISTASEAGAADVSELAKFIAARRIKAIFVESSVPPRTIEAVKEAVRAEGFNVEIGGQLYSDAMGSPGTPDGTYPGMVRHNIDTMVAALSTGGTPTSATTTPLEKK
ncbi:MAG: zinc ABC transporter substrate-binding protein [Candidatus Sumerlaeaceae bacterium]|nr:zinc ABC transporter substrate-binding protein [Candidatus Sumerlaeaceae bacterium]